MTRCVLFSFVVTVLVFTGCGSGSDQAWSQVSGDWVLQSVVVDGGDVVALPERPIDLRIDAGQVAGSSGCNTLGGTATFNDDGSLDMGDLAWTLMACADVELMTFEQRYTGALTAVTSWSVNGDQLTLAGEGSQATYSRAASPR